MMDIARCQIAVEVCPQHGVIVVLHALVELSRSPHPFGGSTFTLMPVVRAHHFSLN